MITSRVLSCGEPLDEPPLLGAYIPDEAIDQTGFAQKPVNYRRSFLFLNRFANTVVAFLAKFALWIIISLLLLAKFALWIIISSVLLLLLLFFSNDKDSRLSGHTMYKIRKRKLTGA